MKIVWQQPKTSHNNSNSQKKISQELENDDSN